MLAICTAIYVSFRGGLQSTSWKEYLDWLSLIIVERHLIQQFKQHQYFQVPLNISLVMIMSGAWFHKELIKILTLEWLETYVISFMLIKQHASTLNSYQVYMVLVLKCLLQIQTQPSFWQIHQNRSRIR